MGRTLDRLGAVLLSVQPDAAADSLDTLRTNERRSAERAAGRGRNRRRRPGVAREPRLRSGAAIYGIVGASSALDQSIVVARSKATKQSRSGWFRCKPPWIASLSL